ncbi:MAG: beta-lactamase family protein, partial [Anaerolineae bacterium]|nr:beta-lactamase family protein [Anaerolineae bacterium]MCB0241382.1 beta-lactamase family protein [Anaerolineae bacterium]
MPDLLAKYGVPGSVVSYIENGEVVWTQAYGMADVGSGRAMQPDMLLEHGSNGKALTAWAVMKLVEQGKVDLDAPVNSYLKRWQVTSDRYDASQVTLRRLLSHTAG